MKSLDAAKLVIAGQHESGRPVTPLALQKLLFYCHAYHLAFLDKPLVNESVEAWTYGPVVPSVYHEYKKYDSAQIPMQEFDSSAIDGLTPDTLQVVTLVLSRYGAFEPMALVNMTHQEAPWRDNYKQGLNQEIPDSVIKNFYAKFITRGAAN